MRQARLISRLLAVLSCFVVLVAACTSPLADSNDPALSTTAPPPPTSPDESAPDDSGRQPQDPGGTPGFGPADERLADLTGQLAISMDSGELWVMDPDGFGPELVAGDTRGRANQPTWLKDSATLAYAYFGTDRRGIGYFGLDTADDPFSDVSGNPVYYLQWSPNASDIAFLHASNDQRNTEFGLARPTERGEALDQGAPFFLSWGLDGSKLAAHVDEQRVDVWNTADRTVETLFETDTSFIAPTYLTPSTLLSAREGAMGLTSISTGTTISVLARTGGQVRFVPSPDGTLIAYSGGDEDRDLKIVEVATGASFSLTSDVPIAWEWSSDGSRLAWLTSDAVGLFRWHFFDLQLGEEIGLSQPYSPSSFERAAILPFFAQYALSHNRWSPDASAFAYAGQAADGLTGIWVELVDDDAGATLVSPGNFVTWSQNDSGGGGGRNPV